MNLPLKSHILPSTFRHWPLAVSLLATFLFSSSASALLMRGGDGPEPVIVQVKESLRLSNGLDTSLSELAQLQQGAGVTVEKWWAGPKLLEQISFPKDFTEEQALEVIKLLQESGVVEKVVAVSAFNLEFKLGDFVRAYTPNQDIPEAALRGLDAEELSGPGIPQIDFAEAVNAPHVPNQIIVGWKPKYAWRADQNGFRENISDFHDSVEAHVLQEMTPTPTDLIQVIEFDDPETSLLDKLKEYANSPWVDYVQPNYIYSQYDLALSKAVGRARDHNMVIVAAAGNGDDTNHIGFNCDDPDKLINPASIPKDNVIAVGATRVRPDRPDLDEKKPDFSNFGKYRVELGAPGGEDGVADGETYGIIGLTQFPDDPSPLFPPYKRLSGTSFSAPQVVGALALVKSKYPWEDYAGIRDRVLMGTDDVDVLDGVFRSGRLNLSKALQKRTLIKNLSTRARVEGGEKVMIAGFVIGGSSAPCGAAPLSPCLKVAIRGLGPSVPVGVNVARLVDPVIELHRPDGSVDSNDNWQDDPSAAEVTANGLQPSSLSEAAMIRSLPPGAYTVILRGHGSSNDYGVGLVELYALGNDEQFRFRNISTRCLVGTGDNVAIAGTILQNPGAVLDQVNSPASPPPKRRILSFGRGPSLQRFGLTGTLPNPYLELHQVQNGIDTIIAYNDQWKDIDGPSTGLEDKLVAAGFMPPPYLTEQYLNESALWPTLRPDSYTAILKDTDNASGIGLIEFYEY